MRIRETLTERFDRRCYYKERNGYQYDIEKLKLPELLGAGLSW